jgi:hypothetical protein
VSELPFGITRSEILDLAAQKIADSACEDNCIEDRVNRLVTERVKQAFDNGLTKRIDEFLTSEMEKLLNREICPVDIWGDKTGTPTTIRAQLAERAKIFWDVNVDREGKRESYGGQPRHKVLFEKIVNEQFSEAIKTNSVAIAEAFKTALRADAARIAIEHIDKLINIPKR